MDRIPYPSPSDIVRLNEQIPSWSISSRDFQVKSNANSQNDLFTPFEISAWSKMLGYRLKETDYSFIMASYYLEKGIPDEEWYSATETGISYFPKFNEEHDANKFGFEYYSDVYFYKAFSTLDTIAHILTLVYNLTWDEKEKISFFNAVNKIKQIAPDLYKKLKSIMTSTRYRKINRLRNNSTHNFSDGYVDSGVVRKNNKTLLTVGNYMTSKEKYSLMQWMCKNLIGIINLIKTKSLI